MFDLHPRLWAARKIGWLSQKLKRKGRNRKLEQEIRETALRFGLLSEYTSYLVQERNEVVTRATPAMHVDAIQAVGSPAQAHGALAVEAARLRQAQRTVRTSKDADRFAEEVLARRNHAEERHVAGRLFVERAGVWTDIVHADSASVFEVEAFSEAYFVLLRSLPELKPYLMAFERVVISGKNVSIRVSDTGAARLSARRARQLVESFRGS